MDPEKVKSIPEQYRQSVHLTLRVSPDIKNWLVKNHCSATAIFHEAIKELGYTKANIPEVEEGSELDSRRLPEFLESTDEDPGYYVKKQVQTKDGIRTILIKQYRPKRYGRGKGNIQAQRHRWKIKNRRRRR